MIEKIISNGYGALSASYLVIHETANPGATAANHVKLWSNPDYYYQVHYVADWTSIYHCVPDNRLCYHVGNGNQYCVGIELCHATSQSDFDKVYQTGVTFAADYLKAKGWGIDRLLSHKEAAERWGGSDHTDPISYFAAYGKSWDGFKQDVQKAMAGRIEVSAYVYDYAYYAQYSDLRKAFGAKQASYAQHFLTYGKHEGRQASVLFNPALYKAAYIDLQRAFGKEWADYYKHYISNGVKEGRKASYVFDPIFYRKKYADLQNAFGTDWKKYADHFLSCGMKEGRQGSAEFDPKKYKAKYKDLAKAFGNTWPAYYRHYEFYGRKEGRSID